MDKLMTLVTIAAGASSLWFTSFIAHDKFVGFSSNVELAPDFKVTYQCSSFDKLEGLDMQVKGDLVTVNYGGLGRRRGLRNFTCND